MEALQLVVVKGKDPQGPLHGERLLRQVTQVVVVQLWRTTTTTTGQDVLHTRMKTMNNDDEGQSRYGKQIVKMMDRDS